MEKQSVEKLINDGYIFIRKEDSTNAKTCKTTPIIKYSDDFGVWKKHSEYKTKIERDNAFKHMISSKELNFLG